MTYHRATAKQIVLDLLVTWGATARPGMSELFDVLGSFRGRDRLATLPRILEIPGIDLGPELQGEVSELIEASRGGDSLTPGFETRVDRVLARVVPILRGGLEEQRGALRTDLAGWVRVLPAAERDPILERFWGTAEGRDLPDLMTALRNLGDVGEMLDRVREQTEGEIRSLLESGGTQTGDSSALEHARGALASGDPLQLLAARRALTTIHAREEHGRTSQQLEAGQQRLSDLCQRGRQLLESGDGAAVGAVRGILETTLSACEDLVLSSTESASGEEVAAWARSIASREASLGAMLESLSASGVVSTENQRAVAETVARKITDLAPDDTEAQQRASALLAAAASRGPEFYQALGQATTWIEKRQTGSTAERSAAEKELRAASRRLAAELEKSAPSIPAERVVGARVLIEKTEESIAAGDPAAMRSLGSRLEKEAAELRQLADRAEEYLTSRESAERKRITGGAKIYRGLANGADAKKLGALLARAEAARAEELEEIEGGIRTVKSRVGNRIRVEAAGVARRADQQLKRKRGKPAAAELEKAAEALRAARENDDLQSTVECSATLKRQLPKFGGTTFYAGLGVLAVVVLAGAFFVWQSFSEDTHAYQFTLMADENAVGEATVMLVQNGEIFAQESYPAGQTAGFELPAGRYEIFVNGRYTGTVIEVPDDPPQVTGIPVPR